MDSTSLEAFEARAAAAEQRLAALELGAGKPCLAMRRSPIRMKISTILI
jgi:hypothetical protein